MSVPQGHEPGVRTPPPLRPDPTDGGACETEGWWPRDPGPDHLPAEPFNSRRRWAGRLGFPFLALAVLAAWRGLQVASGAEASAVPPWAWWTLAAVSGVAGLAMIRFRHRSAE